MVDRGDGDSHVRLESQRWARIFHTGLIANAILVVMTLVYAWATPGGPHRALIAALASLFLAALAALAFVPAHKVADAPWRTPFFHCWSITCMGMSFLLIWLDGGVGSPTLLYLYMIMIFASLSYSVPSNIGYAIAGLAGYCVIALIQPNGPGMGVDNLFKLALLALAYGFSVSVAYNHSALAADNADMRQRLADTARRDSLTGCLNRRGFNESLEHELARSRRAHTPLSLLLIDIDHFKDVNDQHGHLEGDHVLCRVAELASRAARGADVFARLGGDEFVLLAPDTGASEATAIALRLSSQVVDLGLPCEVTLSIGICSVICTADVGADDLLGCADRALYEVKRRGRNGVHAVELPVIHAVGARAAS